MWTVQRQYAVYDAEANRFNVRWMAIPNATFSTWKDARDYQRAWLWDGASRLQFSEVN